MKSLRNKERRTPSAGFTATRQLLCMAAKITGWSSSKVEWCRHFILPSFLRSLFRFSVILLLIYATCRTSRRSRSTDIHDTIIHIISIIVIAVIHSVQYLAPATLLTITITTATSTTTPVIKALLFQLHATSARFLLWGARHCLARWLQRPQSNVKSVCVSVKCACVCDSHTFHQYQSKAIEFYFYWGIKSFFSQDPRAQIYLKCMAGEEQEKTRREKFFTVSSATLQRA